MRLAALLPLCCIVVGSAGAAGGADWPQFRGPARDGRTAEALTLENWPEGRGPKVLWRAQVGKGHSAASVVGGRVYTMGWDGAEDTVVCLDAATGKPIWRRSYPCRTIVQWPGPRATPTVHGGAVYTLGQHGQLFAWDAATGEQRWRVQLAKEYEPDVDYGFAWSPLVEGELLILPAGKRGTALRLGDGSAAWGGEKERGACASPVPFTTPDGKRGVAMILTDPGRDSASLVAVEPATGATIFRHGPWKEKWGAACVDLVVHDAHAFITTAEQHRRAARFTIDGARLREDWSTSAFAGYTGNAVLLDGHLYAVSARGLLTCLDWATGKKRWEQRGFGEHGSLIAARDRLIVQSSQGELAVVAAAPRGYQELRRAAVFKGDARTFTAPVLADGRLYVRSYAGELVCLRP